MLRIMLADDHHVIRLGLRSLLERQPEWRCAAKQQIGERSSKWLPP